VNTWDRHPGEPILWYGRFDRYYRPLGTERSLLGAYNVWRKAETDREPATGTPEWWRKRSDEWHWQERAEAWDAEQRRRRMATEQAELDAMYERHARLGLRLQLVGGTRLQQLTDTPEELTPNDARLAVKDGIDIERTAKGLPKEFWQIAGMSDDELLSWYRERYTATDASGSRDEAARDTDSSGADE